MAVTREEKFLKAMLSDEPGRIPRGVSRAGKLMEQIAKRACENDTFCEGGEGGGASLPENPGNYQYLVTNGNGQWGTADRLAYSEENTVEVFDSFLSFEFSDDGGWIAYVDGDTDYFTDGETFVLKYNNQVIADKIIVANSEIETRITNDMGDLLDLTIEKSAEGKYLVLVSGGTDTEPSLYEKLALYHVANTIHPIDPKFLPYNVFVVTLNYNEDSNYPTPDKTWDEVLAAYNSGAAMFVRNNVLDDDDYHSGIVGKHMLLPFTEIDAEKATFCGVYLNPDSSSTECYICRGYVNADGTGDWIFNALTGVSTPT